MDDHHGRGNLRKRENNDDRTTNRRRQTNQIVTNEPLNHGAQADDDAPLSLSLGPTPLTTATLRLTPPSPMMTGFSSPHDFMARLASSHSYFVTSPAYLASSSQSNSLYQTGSRGSLTPMQPLLSFFTSLDSNPPSARPRPAMVRPVASVNAESRRSFRSQPSDDDTIPPPFPWATNKRGRIQSLEYLESKQMTTITGEVQCKHCEKVYEVSYNLRERFSEVENIFVTRKRIMRERAPPIWSNPELVRCELCGRDKAVKPVIADRKSRINWLFLLLGQTLGYCTLEQLKNFCKHSKSHRTGAKDRVLYLTYLGLCKMLEPNRELFKF